MVDKLRNKRLCGDEDQHGSADDSEESGSCGVYGFGVGDVKHGNDPLVMREYGEEESGC